MVACYLYYITGGIINKWELDPTIPKEDENNLEIKDDEQFSLKENGDYRVFSNISFWGSDQTCQYQLMRIINNSSNPIQRCNNPVKNRNNPNIVSCSMNTNIKIQNSEKFYFKINNKSNLIMTPKLTYFKITRTLLQEETVTKTKLRTPKVLQTSPNPP